MCYFIRYTRIAFRLALPVAFVLLSSCVVYTKPDTEKSIKRDMIACENPRPEMCTRDFRPVCSLSESGVYKTYSNACEACSNKPVLSYYKGVCKN